MNWLKQILYFTKRRSTSIYALIGMLMSSLISSNVFSQDTLNQYESTSISNDYSRDYWKRSDSPLLGQLIPVNQINLQKGVHLIDVEAQAKEWQGVTNPFDTMGLGNIDTKNQESIVRLRYAFPLARYTYIGLSLGFATRNEAESYSEKGMTDPELFIGQHFPWRNGNVRLSLTASPSVGPAELTRDISMDTNSIVDSSKGNFNRGGWSVRPEVSVTGRVKRLIIGAEISYLYMADRTINEKITVSQDALQDPDVMTGLSHQYLGFNQTQFGFNNMGLGGGGSRFLTGQEIQTTVSGGSAWALKGLIEFPDWYRLGGEIIYGQVGTSNRKNEFGKEVQNEGGDFQELRLYARYKLSDGMSLIPLLSYMPELPLTRGQQRLESTSNVWGVQVTFRSKFEL